MQCASPSHVAKVGNDEQRATNLSLKILADIRAPTIFHKSDKIWGDTILTKILADIRGPLE